jgi:hypothetical protein
MPWPVGNTLAYYSKEYITRVKKYYYLDPRVCTRIFFTADINFILW